MPLNQVASLSVPEPTLIVAQPFDPSLMSAIERGIQKSNLGLNPASDGKVLRIPIPSLTEERRKEMSRLVHKYAEEGRNAVRQVRRDANDRLKKLLKDHKISEDDERRALDDVQKITDQHVDDDRRPAEEEGPGAAREVSRGHVFFSHLECSVPCGAGPFDPRQVHHLCAVRRAAARALRPDRREALAKRVARRAAKPRCGATAELMPLFDPRQRARVAGHARRGLDAADSRAPPRQGARPRSALRQGRVAQPDELLQGARAFRRGDARALPGRQGAVDSDRGQRRQRHGRLRRARRPRARRSSCRRT